MPDSAFKKKTKKFNPSQFVPNKFNEVFSSANHFLETEEKVRNPFVELQNVQEVPFPKAEDEHKITPVEG